MINIKRKDLSQIYYLNKELEMWEHKLKELEATVDAIGSPSAMDATGIHSTKTSDRTGNSAIAIAETRKIIEGKYAEIRQKRFELMRWITTLEDSMMRQIIMYRCIDLLTWEEVAAKIGGYNSADSVRMMYNRLFK